MDSDWGDWNGQEMYDELDTTIEEADEELDNEYVELLELRTG